LLLAASADTILGMDVSDKMWESEPATGGTKPRVGPSGGDSSKRRSGMLRAETVRLELSDRIVSDRLAVGTRLPSEPKLAAELGVSRATIRDALRALEQEGLVRRVKGSGTYVAHPRVPNSIDMNFGVTEAIRQGGMRPGVEQARHWIEAVPASEAERLALAPGEDVLIIDRVRTADGRPVVVSRDVLPHALLQGREDVVDALLVGSVYEVLEKEFGITIQYGIANLWPVHAERSLAERLRVEQGDLLFYLWQIDYGENGDPVLSSHEYHLADAFAFSVVRRGPGKRHT
jgi:GntR family transcriptional regulator